MARQDAALQTVTACDWPINPYADGMNAITLTNAHGVTARFIPYGATLTEWHVLDRYGQSGDVVLGFDTLAEYQSEKNQSFGCTTGRVANRIAGGRFELDGKTYQLAQNLGQNHLHGGGDRRLSKVMWEVASADAHRVAFTYVSPDGEENYPGTLSLRVVYALSDAGEIRIDYEAISDAPTPVNLTNHTYFNLSGAGSSLIDDHVLMIAAEYYTPTDSSLIPTGEIAPVAGTPLDFRSPRAIGERVGELLGTPAAGYDHNFVLNDWDGTLRLAAKVTDPRSGRVLTVHTTQPGMQLYTGNHLGGQFGKQGQVYPSRSAFCLETQHLPDSVNHANFPSIILRPGSVYRETCVYTITA
jgi:aldose 1-epimerase